MLDAFVVYWLLVGETHVMSTRHCRLSFIVQISRCQYTRKCNFKKLGALLVANFIWNGIKMDICERNVERRETAIRDRVIWEITRYNFASCFNMRNNNISRSLHSGCLHSTSMACQCWSFYFFHFDSWNECVCNWLHCNFMCKETFRIVNSRPTAAINWFQTQPLT